MDEKELELERIREEEKRRRAAEAAAEPNSTTPSVAGQPENIDKPAIQTAEDSPSTPFLAHSGKTNKFELVDPEDPKREKVEVFAFRPKDDIKAEEKAIISDLIRKNKDRFLEHNPDFKDDIEGLVKYFESGDYLKKGDSQGRTGINGFTPELAAEAVIKGENQFGKESEIARTDKGNIILWPEIQEKLVENEEKFTKRGEGSYISEVRNTVIERDLRNVAQTIADNMNIQPSSSTPTQAPQTRTKPPQTTR